MPFSPSPHHRTRGFTLIELLTVIAIIAVLMGLLFPAVAIVKRNMNNAKARNDVMQIVTGVKAYYTEYAKYPTVVQAGTQNGGGKAEVGDVVVSDEEAEIDVLNSELFNTLRSIPEGINKENVMNPRKVSFFEARAVPNPSQPRNGFVDKAEANFRGCFFDPFGKQYCVVMDGNYDGKIKVTEYYSDFPEDDSPRTGVGAFSMGVDVALGKAGDKIFKQGTVLSDDIVSWQ